MNKTKPERTIQTEFAKEDQKSLSNRMINNLKMMMHQKRHIMEKKGEGERQRIGVFSKKFTLGLKIKFLKEKK